MKSIIHLIKIRLNTGKLLNYEEASSYTYHVGELIYVKTSYGFAPIQVSAIRKRRNLVIIDAFPIVDPRYDPDEVWELHYAS